MIFRLQSQGSPKKGSLGIAMIFFIIAIAGVILTISSPAEKPESNESEKSSTEAIQSDQFKSTNYNAYLLRVILITSAIVIVILLGSKWYRRKMSIGNSNKIEMNILSRRYIGPKHSMIIVGVEGRRFLLGITDNSINLISEFDGSDKKDNNATTITEESDKEDNSPSHVKVDSVDTFDSVLKNIKL